MRTIRSLTLTVLSVLAVPLLLAAMLVAIAVLGVIDGVRWVIGKTRVT